MVGLNRPWVHYGNDLGGSEYSGSNLWHWPHTDPIPSMRGLTERDPLPPVGKLTSRDVDRLILDMKGVDVVRIWLHEQFEGLMFDSSETYRIVGAYADFNRKLREILNACERHGVKVYLTLFNAWDGEYEENYSGPAGRHDVYRQFINTKKKILRELIARPGHYMDSVLAPMLKAVKGSPALYGIDICNEPEGFYALDVGMLSTVASKAATDQFITIMANFIKARAPEVQVSVGCMTKPLAEQYARTTKIDFADYHIYSDTGKVSTYYKEDFNGKPCIIGECGFSVRPGQDAVRKVRGFPVAKAIVAGAYLAGYAGALTWPIEGNVSLEMENRALEDWVKEYASYNQQIRPAKPRPFDPWKFFLNWWPW